MIGLSDATVGSITLPTGSSAKDAIRGETLTGEEEVDKQTFKQKDSRLSTDPRLACERWRVAFKDERAALEWIQRQGEGTIIV